MISDLIADFALDELTKLFLRAKVFAREDLHEPAADRVGSAGMTGAYAKATAGGGSIHIEVDSINLNGKGHQLRANAFPLSETRTDDSLQGGSGGYVMLKTLELSQKNSIVGGAVEVKGGYGKNSGYGGSGGVIFYDGSFRLGLKTSVMFGGYGDSKAYKADDVTHAKGCQNGASGTTHWTIYDVLLLDNQYHETDKQTIVELTPNRNPEYKGKNGNTMYMIANDILVGKSSHLCGKLSHAKL